MAIKLSTGLRNALLGTADFKTTFTDGVLEIYSGSAPADGDAAETGTKLIRITVGSGAFTPASPTNGLEFDAPVAGVISKAAAETWSGVGLAAGTAGYFRLYDNDYGTGTSTTAIRLQGTVATSGADLNLSTTTVAVGSPVTIDTCAITLPAA